MENPEFWAKTHGDQPGISVTQHAQNVAAVCRALYSLFLHGSDAGQKDFISWLAAVHDVGKISPQFQAKCPAWLHHAGLADQAAHNHWRVDKFSHASMSQKALEYYWCRQAPNFGNAHTAWAVAVGAHHGRIAHLPTDSFCSDVLPPEIPHSPSIDWLHAQQFFLEQQWQECGCPDVPDISKNDGLLWLTAGLITFADWIASDESFFPSDPDKAQDDPAHAAAQAVASLGFASLDLVRGLSFADIFGYRPYPMQKTAWEHITGPGVYVLEAPMGMGKTEAALMAAYACMEAGTARGLYFGLPTQATSNRIFLRVQQFAQRVFANTIPPQLVHGNAWLRTDMPSPQIPLSADAIVSDAQSWFASPRRALLAPVGVGTVDQALMAALSVRHFALRRLALARKVVILDEVHSYDFYTRGVIQKLCALLAEMGSTVIILSATLTSEARGSLLYPERRIYGMSGHAAEALPYPLLSCRHADAREAFAISSPAPPDHTVEVRFTSQEHALHTAQRSAREGAQVLWICNTVAAAQHAFGQLRAYAAIEQAKGLPPLQLGILHARLPYFMRREREDDWMQRLGKDAQRLGGSILVSTQVVEQSVDLDADLLITELAPTDMLLQRVGRLWRHARNTRPCAQPRMYILEEQAQLAALRSMSVPEIVKALGSKAHVYDPFILLRTLEIWAPLQWVTLPSEIRRLIHTTYAEPDDLPAAWQVLYDARFSQKASQNILASMNADIWRQALSDMEERAPTRIVETQEYSMVLYKRSQNGRITLLDNTEIRPPSKHFDIDMARALHRNTLKIPEYRFNKITTPAALKQYSLDGWIGVRGNRLHLENIKDSYTAQWDEEMGIIWT